MNPIREHLEMTAGSEGAFVRCSRDEALYVTNLPVRSPDCWKKLTKDLENWHMRCEIRGKLLFLTPDDDWIEPFRQWAVKKTSPGMLTVKLSERSGCPICSEERSCWIKGIKQMEMPDGFDYEKHLRQTAAVALRKRCGGLLECCGLCLDMMKGEQHDD